MADGKKPPRDPASASGSASASTSGSPSAKSPQTPRSHVMFAEGSSIEHSPEDIASPRSRKILSRKKTPFAEDLKSSLEAFRSMDEADQLRMADALLSAQQQVREVESQRLKEIATPSLPILEQAQSTTVRKREQINKKTVTLVSPTSESAAKRSHAQVDAECAKDLNDVPKLPQVEKQSSSSISKNNDNGNDNTS